MENTPLHHTSDEPNKLSYEQIKQMTNNLAEEIGRGSFGIVYKGTNSDGKEIAVKVIRIEGIDDSLFQKEFQNLKTLKHQNIVVLLGFCKESEEFPVEYEGRVVPCEKIHRALCMEYVSNGSLGKHLYDEHTGLSWQARYKIIKGICHGLQYLRGLKFPVWHLDLKPANILLTENMVPKIADFGVSKLLGEDKTRRSLNSVGTGGYLPPEYVSHQIISKEFDIFSLGVIMTKVMIGSERYKSIADMPPRKFVKQVHDNWKKRLHELLRRGSLEVHCQQVKTCIEIALECMRPNRQERPIINDIVSRLNETERMIGHLGMEVPEDFLPRMFMEKKLQHTSHEPSKLPYKFLTDITNNFAQDRILGYGAFGTYYRGVLKGRQVIAVKVLMALDIEGRRFLNEFYKLKELKHQNVVQLLGFCHEEEEELVEYEGRIVCASRLHRALCLEFMPNGSLREFLSDEHVAHRWDLRFNIIKGMCDGLKYLRDARIMHFDLKPSSILLDEKMLPKIGSYGLSRLAGEEFTAKTISSLGTIGYMPPEYVNWQVISEEFDIFSLGVIIMEILIRELQHWRIYDMGEHEFTEQIHDYWKRIFLETPSYPSIEEDCKQVRACIKIAILCTEKNRLHRPTMDDIVHKLHMVETKKKDSCSHIEQLRVYPLELCFPFDPKKAVHCSLQINNTGDDRVAFMLVAKSSKSCFVKLPLCGVVPPRCTYTHNLTMRTQSKLPSESIEFVTLQSVAVADLDLQNVGVGSVTAMYEEFFRKAEPAGYAVQEMTLKAVCDTPAEPSAPETTQSMIEIIATRNSQQLLCIDVHPNEPLIVTTNQGGILCVWNYDTMTTLNSIEVTEELVHAAKFISREKWLIAGDSNGCIHVYSYDEKKYVTNVDAHYSSITSLAVHPEHPFVLSSSHDDQLIKLWDWTKEWKFPRVFGGHTSGVTQVKFDPVNTDSFASASMDGTVKIWNVHSDGGCIITLKGCVDGLLCVDYFKRRDRCHLITSTMYGTAQIWDLEMELVEGCDEKKGCVQQLDGHSRRITAINSYPELSLLITGSLDGTIRLWDSETYKLENIIGFNLGAVHTFGFLKGTRMMVGCDQGMAIMEIYLPSKSCTEETMRILSRMESFSTN